MTTRFVYDTAEGMPLILTDGANYYLYGPDGTPYAQITTAGVVTYLHTDQLGSIRMITSSTGTSTGTATYTAYGTRTTTGTTSPFGYAGQYTDSETGLQWLRARYYDPTTAQFLTVDPLAALTGARYSYASGNPITGADPTGLCDGFWGCVGHGLTVGVVNFGRGASFGLSDTIANALSPGASCTVEQNVPMQMVGMLAVVAVSGGTGAAGEGAGAANTGAGAETLVGQSSTYVDLTRGGSIRNVGTNATNTEFAETLTQNGWASQVSRDGAVQIFDQDGARYVLRQQAGSYSGWSADFTPAGSARATLKLRLGFE